MKEFMEKETATEATFETQNAQPRVLVACEFSGIIRDAFAALGYDAWSCDLLPSERTGQHIKGDVINWLAGKPKTISWETGEWCNGTGKNDFGYPAKEYKTASDPEQPWDLLIAHPPCTHLAVSGARWFKDKATEQEEALQFVQTLLNASIERIALENPISIISSRIRKPDQIIQPWQFGHGETKATCLWLKNLPKLVPTNVVEGREARVHRATPGPERWKERSRTLSGIAEAMADQWGNLLLSTQPNENI